MIKTIIGLILLLAPFLFMRKFENKKLGFCYILSFIIAFQLFLAIISQFFHIFTYPIILVVNLIVFLFVLYKTRLKINIGKIDWVLVFVIIVGFISLYSVHYNYSGKYTVAVSPEYQQASKMQYPYPYFADEWYSVAFIKYSISSHSLPLADPLSSSYHSFVNFEFPFHSFLSEISLLLGLNPLTNYSSLAIFSGLLIILLVYLFLRISNIGKLISGVASLSLLYIINGTNLPSIWYLIPITLGIICFLLGMIFISQDKRKMIFLLAFLTLIFYPPLFLFYSLTVFLFFILRKELSNKEKIRIFSWYIAIILGIIILFLLSYLLARGSLASSLTYILSKLFYNTFTPDSIPRFLIWLVIPWFILVFSIVGFFISIKERKWLAGVFLLGLIYWLIYSFSMVRFIIEYERVVVFTSILFVILAGLGLNFLVRRLKEIRFFEKKDILNYILVGILILFFIFSFSYTKRDNWKSLTLENIKTKGIVMPAAPANKYLQEDDIQLFKNIKNKTFLTLPWKGTVIGVATDNIPVSTKPGTITHNPSLLLVFFNLDCSGKEKLVKDYRIEYVYSPEFNCSGFNIVGKSNEGIILYKTDF